MMMTGLLFLVIGLLSGGSMAFYSAVLVGLALAGIGKSIFDPAVQAYVSEQVPFRRRGLAIGLLEVAWAASALIGIPLVGIFIDRYGWRAPFFILSAAGAMGLLSLAVWIKPDRSLRRSPGDNRPWLPAWKKILANRAAMGACGYSFFVQMANDNLFVVYGAWLEQTFQLSIVGIGLGTSVIGFAELAGEFVTAGLSDRVGLKRSLVIGLIGCTLAYAVMPLADASLSMALTGLFFLFFAFEFSVVTGLTLATELSPDARATMMAGYFAAAGAGRVVGALIGGPVWVAGGMLATASVSAAINALALASLIWALKGWQPHSASH
jgi:predicted MFS family arabinose efflux permease